MRNDDWLPKTWCNLLHDYPQLYKQTQIDSASQPSTSVLAPKFPRQPLSLMRQAHDTTRPDVPIPEPIIEQYSAYRPTPFKRAMQFEKAIHSTATIYYKFEGATAVGSHKINSALAQAYYFKQAGVTHLVTGTGGGQWGTALAYACQVFGLKCTVFMVAGSLRQKPRRREFMALYGAQVLESPSDVTVLGQSIKSQDGSTFGSLAVATGEALQFAECTPGCQFAVGSGDYSVLLHQTVIGNEVLNQLRSKNLLPDKVFACMGAGSNFSGISFPLMRACQQARHPCEFVAVEPEACPKLTKGVYAIEKNDFSGTTSFSKMYTLGADFVSPPIHAGGLRYHGTSSFVSALYDHRLFRAKAISEAVSLKAGLCFAKTEGILPAPESAYAIAGLIQEATLPASKGQCFIINISGHGLFDLSAYQAYQNGDFQVTPQTSEIPVTRGKYVVSNEID